MEVIALHQKGKKFFLYSHLLVGFCAWFLCLKMTSCSSYEDMCLLSLRFIVFAVKKLLWKKNILNLNLTSLPPLLALHNLWIACAVWALTLSSWFSALSWTRSVSILRCLFDKQSLAMWVGTSRAWMAFSTRRISVTSNSFSAENFNFFFICVIFCTH